MKGKKYSIKKLLIKFIIIAIIIFVNLYIVYIINPKIIKDKYGQVKEFIFDVSDNIGNFIQNISEQHNMATYKEQEALKDNEFITIKPTEQKIDKNGNLVLTGGSAEIVYYNQNDKKWANKIYGKNDTIGIYGCGPTTLAMIASSFTNVNMNPEQMAKWAYDNNFFCSGSGSYHSIIPEGSKSFGLIAKSFTDYTKEGIIQELATGNIIVALMDKGHFTSGGHFIILRGITLDGKVLIADPQSLENSYIEWDIEIFLDEAKYGSSSGGPLWSIGNNPI